MLFFRFQEDGQAGLLEEDDKAGRLVELAELHSRNP